MKSSSKKILHLIKSLGRGGAEMLLSETLKLHNCSVFEFHYGYFLPWKNQMVESLHSNGGRVICFNANNNLQLMGRIWQVAQYVRTNRIQLIHAHLPWAGILARIVGKITGVPVIYTEHNKQERYHPATRLMNLATMNLQTVVVTVSLDVAESLRNHKIFLKPVVRTILNGVNTVYFNPANSSGEAVREKFNIPSDVPIIGTIAVFRFQKRLDLWMELAKDILSQFETAHFIVVGDGPLKGELEKKRDELGLSERIHFPGLEIEVRPYLAAFDIYMMSSIFEGLPIALLEAMAMQCPVISTDAGGIKEVVNHQVDGLLCSVDDPHQLVEYAGILLTNQPLRLKFGLEARKRVQNAFSMEKMVEELEELYFGIIGNADQYLDS